MNTWAPSRDFPSPGTEPGSLHRCRFFTSWATSEAPATVHGVAEESERTERLSMHARTGEKPSEEVHRRSSGRVPSAGAAMPVGVGCINLLVCLQLRLCTDAAVCKSCHFRWLATASQNHPHLHQPLSKPSCLSAVLLRVAPSSQASAWPSFNVDDYRLQLLWNRRVQS